MNENFRLTYLYVFFEEEPRQSNTPPTEADISIVGSGLLQVYRWYGNAYEHLIIQEGKSSWEKVEEAKIHYDATDDIGEYHA